jgi:hypothetical protein
MSREEMKLTSRARWGDLAFWLGAWSGRRGSDDKYIDGEKSKWKPNLDVVKDILAFCQSHQEAGRDSGVTANLGR